MPLSHTPVEGAAGGGAVSSAGASYTVSSGGELLDRRAGELADPRRRAKREAEAGGCSVAVLMTPLSNQYHASANPATGAQRRTSLDRRHWWQNLAGVAEFAPDLAPD